MTPWTNAITDGRISTDIKQMYGQQGRDGKTKMIESLFRRDEDNKWVLDLKNKTYTEMFSRWKMTTKGSHADALLLEDAERRAGGEDKLQRAIRAGRVRVPRMMRDDGEGKRGPGED